jgi:hypothetical protein
MTDNMADLDATTIRIEACADERLLERELEARKTCGGAVIEAIGYKVPVVGILAYIHPCPLIRVNLLPASDQCRPQQIVVKEERMEHAGGVDRRLMGRLVEN